MGANAPGDEYDPANHRLLVPDCANDTLLALDLATGDLSLLIDTWPWTEPGATACVTELVVDRTGQRAFAVVSRSIPDPTEAGHDCHSSDLVSIDLEARDVTQMKNIDFNCCDDYCGEVRYSSLQIDTARSQLLHLENDAVADYGIYHLSSTPTAPGGAMQRVPLSPDCLPDDENCIGQPWPELASLALDPADPQDQLILLSRQYPIGNYLTGEYVLDTRDIATGTKLGSLPIPIIDGDPAAGTVVDMAVDTDKQRALLTWGRSEHWQVFAVDLVTGDATLLYDGSPTAGGARLACYPWVAFDSLERRLLLAERMGLGQNCERVFAVDADTGAFTQLAGPVARARR